MKLNLGCGQNKLKGYVNVDRFGEPDVLFDLETFPWPWEDNSIDEIMMSHVLEHLGQTCETYFKIIQELYRISKNGCTIHINVPHPRHDHFLSDPTHVRPITTDSILLLSQKKNQEWAEKKYANTPLAKYLNVDFELKKINYVLDPIWQKINQKNKPTQQDILIASKQFNNVIMEIQMILTVVK